MPDSRLDLAMAVDPGELAAAAAVVRRFRRRRRTAVAGIATTGVVALVSSQLLLGGSTSSLEPTGTPYPTTSATAVATAAPPSAQPTASPAAGQAGGLGGGPVVGGEVAPTTGPGSYEERPPHVPRVRGALARKTLPASSTDTSCINYVPVGAAFCAQSKATPNPDGTVLLAYTVCQRQPGLGGVEADFKNALEADFVVVRDGLIVWQWSAYQRFPAAVHSVPIGAKDCVEWSTTWNGLLDDGTRMKPGRYRLRASGRDTKAALPRRVVTWFDLR